MLTKMVERMRCIPLHLFTPTPNLLQICPGHSKPMTISHENLVDFFFNSCDFYLQLTCLFVVCRYADDGDSYWTGYFTSRLTLKGYIRSLSGYYLESRQLEYMVGRKSKGPNTLSLRDALGIAQHHAVTGSQLDEMRIKTDGNAKHCSCSSSGAKKRTWEASHTSFTSKKVKGGDLIVCQSDSGCVSTTKGLTDFTPTLGCNLSMDNTQITRCYKIMLMNIVDDAKKSNLAKVIEDLGGSATYGGRVATHIITGKVRKALNFCTTLCSGAWVLSSAWLKESCREGRFVDEMSYILKDDEYESKYMTDLKGTVLRASGNNGGFLKGFQVCLAAHVQPPINVLSAIIRSAGGNVIRKLEKVRFNKKHICGK